MVLKNYFLLVVALSFFSSSSFSFNLIEKILGSSKEGANIPKGEEIFMCFDSYKDQDFSQQKVTASFNGSTLTNFTFQKSDLSDVDFEGTFLKNCDFRDATFIEKGKTQRVTPKWLKFKGALWNDDNPPVCGEILSTDDD